MRGLGWWLKFAHLIGFCIHRIDTAPCKLNDKSSSKLALQLSSGFISSSTREMFYFIFLQAIYQTDWIFLFWKLLINSNLDFSKILRLKRKVKFSFNLVWSKASEDIVSPWAEKTFLIFQYFDKSCSFLYYF